MSQFFLSNSTNAFVNIFKIIFVSPFHLKVFVRYYLLINIESGEFLK